MTRWGTTERVLAGVVALLAVALLLLILRPTEDESLSDARESMVSSVTSRVPALLEYGSADPDGDLTVAVANVTDAYRPQFEALMRQSINLIPDGLDMRNDVEVEHVGVVEVSEDQGVVMVVLRQTRTTGDVEEVPRLGRLVFELVKEESGWLIDKMSPV